MDTDTPAPLQEAAQLAQLAGWPVGKKSQRLRPTKGGKTAIFLATKMENMWANRVQYGIMWKNMEKYGIISDN